MVEEIKFESFIRNKTGLSCNFAQVKVHLF